MCHCKGYGFWAFLSENGYIHFAHFGLESGMVYEGSTKVYEHIYHFSSKCVRKEEKYVNLKCI